MEITELKKVLNLPVDNYEIISFDFFDTLVHRKVSEKLILKQCVRDFFNSDSLVVDEQLFINEIEQADIDERFSVEQDGFDKEAQLINIYQRIFHTLDLDMTKLSEFCQCIVNAEQNNFILAANVSDVLAKINALNIKLIITSDTSYSQLHFQQFLRHLKIEQFVDKIYLSSHVKLNKASGNLFKHILLMESVPADALLHIGDNAFSDVSIPKNIGISSVFIAYKYSQSAEMSKQVLYDFGYEVLAPLLLSFIDSLLKKKPQQTDYMFLGRDGYMLKEIFDLYSHDEFKDKSLTASYIYINRILANQLTTKQLQQNVLSYISSQFKNEGFWGLVTVFGLNDTDFSIALTAWLNHQKIGKNDFIDRDSGELLLSNETLKVLFTDNLAKKRINVNNYLSKHFPQQKNQSITFVDVGWRGTIYKQLSSSHPEVTDCYLLGYVGDVHPNIDAFISKSNEYSAYIDLFSEYRDLIEYFLSENVSNIIGINDDLDVLYLIHTDKNENLEKQIVQSAIKEYGKRRLNTPLYKESVSQQLIKLQQFFTHLPKVFHSALANINTDIKIQGNSTITMQSLLPSTCNNDNSQSDIKDVQSMIYLYLSFVKDLQSEAELVVYGSGSGADFILPHIKDKCQFIVDINLQIHGNKLMGIPIVGLEALSSYNGVLLITVLGRKNQISQTLAPYDLRLCFLEDYL